jgi:hypothetical protein
VKTKKKSQPDQALIALVKDRVKNEPCEAFGFKSAAWPQGHYCES